MSCYIIYYTLCNWCWLADHLKHNEIIPPPSLHQVTLIKANAVSKWSFISTALCVCVARNSQSVQTGKRGSPHSLSSTPSLYGLHYQWPPAHLSAAHTALYGMDGSVKLRKRKKEIKTQNTSFFALNKPWADQITCIISHICTAS